MKLSQNSGGFTLVELMIYMGIFAIAATTITGILVTTVRVQNQEIASTEVTQQLNFVLNTVQRLVAQSSEVESAYEGTNPSNPCTTFCTLKLRMVPSGTGGLDPTLISSTASGVYVQQGTGAQTALTNTQVAVNNLKFTVYSTTGGHATVQVNASFSYNSTNPQLAITKTLQSAVGRVSAATFDSDLLPDTNSTRDVGQANPTLRWRDIYLAGLLGFGNIASDTPSALAPGSVYYDTLSTSNKLRFWNGTAWGDISPWSTGTGTLYVTSTNVGIGNNAPASAPSLITSPRYFTADLARSPSSLYLAKILRAISVGSFSAMANILSPIFKSYSPDIKVLIKSILYFLTHSATRSTTSSFLSLK